MGIGHAASEFDLPGMSIYAHLTALPGLFSRQGILGVPPTLQGIGSLYTKSCKGAGYRNAWISKVLEYAAADLFNHHVEPYRSLICQGVECAMSFLAPHRVNRLNFDFSDLSCVRVASECAPAEHVTAGFGRFRLLRDPGRTLRYGARIYPGLEDKVDVIFWEREADPACRFAATASFGISQRRLVQDNVRGDFRTYPLDLAVTIETPEHRGVIFDEYLGLVVVYLPLRADAGVCAWENGTRIVNRTLVDGEKDGLSRYFASFFKPDAPERFWVDFLANRLQMSLASVALEICQVLHGMPAERIVPVPVLCGLEQDAVLDLRPAAST